MIQCCSVAIHTYSLYVQLDLFNTKLNGTLQNFKLTLFCVNSVLMYIMCVYISGKCRDLKKFSYRETFCVNKVELYWQYMHI